MLTDDAVQQQEQINLIAARRKILKRLKEWLASELKQRDESDWRYFASQVYVPPEATTLGSGLREDLTACLNNLFEPAKVSTIEVPPSNTPNTKSNTTTANSPAKVTVILGEPGAGKTTLGKYWLRQRLKLFEQAVDTEKDKTPLPIFINLNTALSHSEVNEAILLEKWLTVEYWLTREEVHDLQKYQPLIIFCDGYDEISSEENLYQLNHWENWRETKFIITTRPEKFGTGLDATELYEILMQTFSPTLAKKPTQPASEAGLQLRVLEAFSPQQVSAFIAQWQPLVQANNQWTIEQYEKALDTIPGLKELVSNPVILSLILYALPALEKAYQAKTALERTQLTRLEVYAQFVKQWFEVQAPRVIQKLMEADNVLGKNLQRESFDFEAALLRYTQGLAAWCLFNHDEGKLKLEIPLAETQRRLLLDDNQTIFSKQFSDEEVISLTTALRSGCLLKCDNEYFRFFHKSLIEYFAERHIFAGTVGLLNLTADKVLKEKLSTETISADKLESFALNTAIAEPNLLRMLAEQAKQDEVFRETLYVIVRSSRDAPDIAIAAANAMTILNYAKEPLNLESWQGIHIPGADLSNTILHRVDFRGADVSGVNFRGAYLQAADFTGARLNACEWGAVAAIRFDSDIRGVAYSQDGQWLLVGTELGQIYSVHRDSHAIEWQQKHYRLIPSDKKRLMALTVDGGGVESLPSQYCVTASEGGTLYFWAVETGKSLGKLKTQKHIETIAITARGDYVASGGEDGIIYFWYVKVIKHPICHRHLVGHEGRIYSVSFSEDGRFLASGSVDKTVRLWSAASREALKVFQGHVGYVLSVRFSTDGQLLVSGSYREIRLWSVSNGQVLQVFQEYMDWVSSVNFSADGQFLASGSDDKTVRLWSVASGQPVQEFQGHTGSVFCVHFSEDGQWLASGSWDKTVRLWSVASSETQSVLAGHADRVWCVSFSADGQFLASGSYGVGLWSVASQKPFLKVFRVDANNVFLNVSFSTDGQFLASGGTDGTIRLWSMVSGKLRNVLTGHTNYIWSVNFSADGQFLASGSWDKTIRLWSMARGETQYVLMGHTKEVYSVSFSADGQWLASGSLDGTVRLWSVDSGRAQRVFKGHTDGVRSVSFSVDGKWLASGSWDGTVRLWSMVNGKTQHIFKGHTESVNCVSFNADGEHLASGSEDKTVRLWSVASGQLLHLLPVGFPIFALHWQAHRLAVAGVVNDNYLQVLQYQFMKTDDTHTVTTYQLCRVMNRHPRIVAAMDFRHQTLQLNHSQGLNPYQYRFLQNQGAEGKPSQFAATNIDIDELKAEEAELKRLITIRVNLQKPGQSTRLAQSIFANFHGSSPVVGLANWHVYWLRVTKPRLKGQRGSASGGNRHVYGLVEGLDPTGRRLLIRFDLVEDSAEKRFARVKVKSCIAKDSATLETGRGLFLDLFKGGRIENPENLVVYYLGGIDKAPLLNLLQKLIDEQARQPSKSQTDKNQTSDTSVRIHYRLLGGNPTIGSSHNCLTWLRHICQGIPNLELPPRQWSERLVADSASVLPEGVGFFAKSLPKNVALIDVTPWSQSASVTHSPVRMG